MPCLAIHLGLYKFQFAFDLEIVMFYVVMFEVVMQLCVEDYEQN